MTVTEVEDAKAAGPEWDCTEFLDAHPDQDEHSDICIDGDEHTINPDSVIPVKGDWIINVECEKCGRSGSISIDLNEMQW